MRALFWLIGLFSLAVGLSLAARYNDGYVLFVLPPWRVEVSLNLLVVLWLAAFAILYLLLRLVVNTLRMPGQVRAFRERKKKEKGQRSLREALSSLFEGRYGQAIKSAEIAAATGEAPGLSALVAARAAHAMNDEARFQSWLARAARHDAQVRSARLMTQADLYCRSRDFTAALESLETLDRGGQRHIAALRLALKVRQGAGQWQEVLRLARHLEKHKVIGSEHAAALKARANQELMRGMEHDPLGLARYFDDLPAAERRDAKMAALAARALLDAGDEASLLSARQVIEEALEAEWEPLLARLYGEIKGGDLRARTAKAEKWLKSHTEDAQLLMTLGRLCREQQLWGKAESYLEAALAVEPGRAAHLELARLYDILGRSESANKHYREAAEF
ncbi:MAG: heme biosynthesis protein HemY [Rhodocyclaceae bacterium]|nr:heme biosynthesis protein HemY [Rhodocyclaceae bacterium]